MARCMYRAPWRGGKDHLQFLLSVLWVVLVVRLVVRCCAPPVFFCVLLVEWFVLLVLLF